MNNIAGLAGGALIHISKKVFVTVAVLWLAGGHACAQINAYAKVTSITGGNVLNLSNINETFHTFTVGQEVVIMQMQGDVIGGNINDNASFGNLAMIGSVGQYEIQTITARTATTLTLSGALVNSYTFSANTSVQVISNRLLGTPDFTTTANIVALDWNGNIGGVIAIKVKGVFTIAHNITADGSGFRGGVQSTADGAVDCNTLWRTNGASLSGEKGEGIFKRTLAIQRYGRAKITNGGGGNRHNAGGGGGGNVSTGGLGGHGYLCDANPVGGQGGIALNSTVSRVFMGGGGGGGHQNNNNGSAGGDGGGIILIAASRIVTTGTCPGGRISVNGLSSTNGTNDGAGGAGAGGSIVMEVGSFGVVAGCPLNIAANGANAGSSVFSEVVGGGGGGGQGRVFISTNVYPNVTVTTNNGAAGCNNNSMPCNSAAGSPGGSNGDGVSDNSGNTPLPVTLLYFNGLFDKSAGNIQLQWTTVTERNNSHFTLERSPDGIQFSPVATVTGQGDSRQLHTYRWNDENIHAQRYYYRLQQTDLDGRQEYLGVIVVNADRDTNPEVYIYPNPATAGETVQADFIGIPTGQYVLRIVSMEGREIMRKEQAIVSPFESITLDMPGTGKGIYTLIISSEKYSLSKKILER